MTADLAAFIREQLDADEQVVAAMEREAERVRTAPIFGGHPPGWLAGVDIFVSPKRWLAEIDVKRRLLDEAESCCGRDLPDGAQEGRDPDEIMRDEAVHDAMQEVVRLLALPYADRPGYREEWRP